MYYSTVIKDHAVPAVESAYDVYVICRVCSIIPHLRGEVVNSKLRGVFDNTLCSHRTEYELGHRRVRWLALLSHIAQRPETRADRLVPVKISIIEDEEPEFLRIAL
jgi:hypothetical protein